MPDSAGGDIVVGGRFFLAGGSPATRIARWDGSTWSALSSGMNDLVECLATLPNGDIVAGGVFTTAGGVAVNRIARWDGTAWHAMGSGMNAQVDALIVMPNGDLMAGGLFSTAGGVAAQGIARWNGTTWSSIGGTPLNGSVWGFTLMPDNDLVAVGNFTSIGSSIASWDGASWQSFDGGVASGVNCVAPFKGGLVVGGGFTVVDGRPSRKFGRLVSTCPAEANPIATACIGPAGPMTLTSNLPWTGSTFESTVTGFGPNAVGASLLGIGSQTPPLSLSLLHPAGLPNCDVVAPTDAVQLVIPAGGQSGYQFTIPNSSAFAGLPLSHQFIQVELDTSANVVSLSSSNGLSLVVGTF